MSDHENCLCVQVLRAQQATADRKRAEKVQRWLIEHRVPHYVTEYIEDLRGRALGTDPLCHGRTTQTTE